MQRSHAGILQGCWCPAGVHCSSGATGTTGACREGQHCLCSTEESGHHTVPFSSVIPLSGWEFSTIPEKLLICWRQGERLLRDCIMPASWSLPLCFWLPHVQHAPGLCQQSQLRILHASAAQTNNSDTLKEWWVSFWSSIISPIEKQRARTTQLRPFYSISTYLSYSSRSLNSLTGQIHRSLNFLNQRHGLLLSLTAALLFLPCLAETLLLLGLKLVEKLIITCHSCSASWLKLWILVVSLAMGSTCSQGSSGALPSPFVKQLCSSLFHIRYYFWALFFFFLRRWKLWVR